MTYIKGIDRNQMCLPAFLEDLIPQDSPVRLIDAFVDSLSLAELGFCRTEPAQTGRPAYDPNDLLKLYLYGYFHRIRSSRKLMEECRRNIELFFLLNRLTPDFRTIADFRKENAKALRNVFLQFTKLCLSLSPPGEVLAIDGSKFRAVNGNKRMYNDAILKKKLQRIETKMEEYLQLLDQADQSESSESDAPLLPISEIKEKLHQLQERKTRYEGYRKELSDTGESQKLLTDPQARMMHSHKDGFHCCYNVQTAVDSDRHWITDYLVTNHANDQGLLHSFTNQIKETLQTPVLQIVADKGYDCKEEITACLLDGTIPHVGFKDDEEERRIPLEYIAAEIDEQTYRSTQPQDIRKCLHAGVLPRIYEGTIVSLEVHPLGSIGAFLRGSDQSFVTCPMGFRLSKRKNKKEGIEYASHVACRQCSNRCTPSKNPKHVYFGPASSCVAVRMYGDAPALITPPPGFTPTNSFFKKNPVEKTILLRIRDDIPKQKQRLCISEHPFGTVKWYHGAHFLLCRGIEKATAELGLSFLAYNMRRAIHLYGVPALLGVLRG